MTYLDDVAKQIASHGPAEARPDGNPLALFRLNAVLALAKGEATDARDVHHASAARMQESDPEHRSLRPFAELDAQTQAADEPYIEAIRAVARESLSHADRAGPG